MKACRFLAAALLSVSACAVAAAETMRAPDPLFDSDELLRITLTGPFRTISRDGDEDPERRPGTLSYTAADGSTVTFSAELEPRGKSRRDRKICTFPPLWVRLDKDEIDDTLFDKQKRLKLVTHCRSSKSFQDYVVKEYLVYRVFNQLTDASFRVRLLEVTYVDSERDDSVTRYGFFIEHKDRLAKRLGRELMEPAERIPTASLDPDQAAISELFQFMVSNTDFSMIAPPIDDVCCHNSVLFDAGEGMYLPVPYDFDRTGLVNPPNGLPDANLGQRSFRDRVYRGFCRDQAVADAALEKTRAKRSAIEGVIRDQRELSDRAKDQALRYIASYYDIIDDERKRARELKCRNVQ
jgi:hypothetical protein